MGRYFGYLILGLFSLPLVAGLAGTLLPALGGMPELAPGNGLSILLLDPRFLPALMLTLKTGLVATILVLLLTLAILVSVHGTRLWRWVLGMLPPLLSVPHAAIAVGLVFLIAPSGWLVRLLSPAFTGWQRPPLDWVIPDAGGWSLILGLVIKETPFLLLAASAQLATLNVDAALRIGRTLGYAPARCWSRLILPLLYPRIRLTLFIILAFNLSVVDMALLLGPGNPPTFSVFLMSLVNDPGSRAAASAGALLLGIGVGFAFVLVIVLEKLISAVAGYRRQSGHRGRGFGFWRTLACFSAVLLLGLGFVSLLMLALWSVARRWRFPNALPTEWTQRHWLNHASLYEASLSTLSFALATVLLSVLAAVCWLECERKHGLPNVDWLWYVPLLIPQITLLFGWQAAALYFSFDGSWLTVVFAHWVYAVPYVVLILAVAWRELDPAWNHAAAVLGAGYWRRLWQVRLPMLMVPLSQAAAVALAVSVAQYLPTLLLGAGRHQTLAIELVTSFGGVDRRVIAVLAVMQSALPLLAFSLALFFSNRSSFGVMKSSRQHLATRERAL